MKLIPKNWASFQHYKNRCPPWIKLHRDLLNDRDFMCLPIASKAIAPLLWLLASEHQDGIFEAEIQELMFRLRISEHELTSGLKPLIDKGFFLDASTMLAPCLQVATPETETETETDIKAVRKRTTVFQKPDDVDQELWDAFVVQRKAKKAPITEIAIKGINREAEKLGWSLSDALREIIERNWQSFKAEWIASAKPKSVANDTFAGSL